VGQRFMIESRIIMKAACWAGSAFSMTARQPVSSKT
jgi:hypothetical protein